jgi:hypothetical protein
MVTCWVVSTRELEVLRCLINTGRHANTVPRVDRCVDERHVRGAVLLFRLQTLRIMVLELRDKAPGIVSRNTERLRRAPVHSMLSLTLAKALNNRSYTHWKVAWQHLDCHGQIGGDIRRRCRGYGIDGSSLKRADFLDRAGKLAGWFSRARRRPATLEPVPPQHEGRCSRCQ